jgi:hypothetical protein
MQHSPFAEGAIVVKTTDDGSAQLEKLNSLSTLTDVIPVNSFP